MKQLENKILKNIYMWETKQTIVEIVARFLLTIILAGFGIYIVADIISTLIQQQTLDVLRLFQEDREIIQNNIRGVLDTLYIELPIFEIILSIIVVSTIVITILLFVKNYARIKKKIRALKKYWVNH